MTVMPFPETRVRQRSRSNGAVCRAKPVWIPGILNAWSIQISATVARFRGNVRSRRSGSMPLIEGKKRHDSFPLNEQTSLSLHFFKKKLEILLIYAILGHIFASMTSDNQKLQEVIRKHL